MPLRSCAPRAKDLSIEHAPAVRCEARSRPGAGADRMLPAGLLLQGLIGHNQGKVMTRSISRKAALLSILLSAVFVGFPAAAQQAIPKSGWRVIYVTSQETAKEDGAVSNAFDNDPSTIWHTAWSSSVPKPPHEVRIDFGKDYSISQLRYLPRQDSSRNGAIGNFSLQVSRDGSSWSQVVAGAFGAERKEQTVAFTPLLTRFVRLIATSELFGNPWASAAEIGFAGSASSTGGQPTSPPSTPPTNPTPDSERLDWDEVVQNATGQVQMVSSEDQFNARAAGARPGDVIIVKNGMYDGWQLRIPANGTADRPIVYMAQSPGGVTIRGRYKNAVMVYGDYNIVAGFNFEDCGGYAVRMIGASNNRLTESTFENCGEYEIDRIVDITHGANHNRVDHNVMIGNRSMGVAINLPRPGIDDFPLSLHNRIDHNLFRDSVRGPEGNGRCPIQIGQWVGNDLVTWPNSFAKIEYNEFRDYQASINSKSNGEIYRYNRFVRSGGISLRGGDQKVVDGNVFDRVEIPLWVNGTKHRIINNVMINPEIGVMIAKWGKFQINSSGKISSTPPTGDILVANNTIVGSTRSGIELGRVWGYPTSGWVVANNLPFSISVVNNIFAGTAGTLVNYMSGKDIKVNRNVLHATGTAVRGYIGLAAVETNPQLDSAYRPLAGSVVRDIAVPLGEITTDAVGTRRPRGRGPDVGAFEGEG